MNVLSLFDGMSCGQIALDKLGYPVEQYFACEIDKHAIKLTKAKWPNMVHLGSVVDVHAKDLPKIDIVIGGSPCQGFSNAGKGLNFNDPRSKLFFEFVRLYHECRERNPDVLFMLENVRMKKEWEDIISRILEIQPININSALVSAQNRERLYWTNIAMKKRGLFEDNYCSIPQPEDKFIFLKHILEPVVDEKYYLKGKVFEELLLSLQKVNIDDNEFGCLKFGRNDEGKQIRKESKKNLGKDYSPFQEKTITGIDHEKMNTILTGSSRDNLIFVIDKKGKIKSNQQKSGCFTAGGNSGGNHSDMDLIVEPVCVAMRGRQSEIGKPIKQQLEINKSGKTNCITTVAKDNLIMFKENYMQWEGGFEQDNRAYYEDGKSGTLDIKPARQKVLLNDFRIRRLTPVEVARLQTVPDDYFNDIRGGICSDTQIYKMCGNGWTVDVICHILSFMK